MSDPTAGPRAGPKSERDAQPGANPAAPRAELVTRNLRTIGVLAAIFLLPLVTAFWMYYGGGWRPATRTNHGELLEPVRPLPRAELREANGQVAAADLFDSKWALAYIGDGECDRACRTTLHFMRQTRLSLNNEMTRVTRVFLATEHCCNREFLEREHPGLVVIDATGPEAADLVQAFPQTERPYSLFIIDPLGNLVMRYDARNDPKGLLTDLKKLLKLSHIG
jgi:cytochrome oxidase Cu insertion factor (SCO1/SenC/PrrC family)